jgi:hypothetical protein
MLRYEIFLCFSKFLFIHVDTLFFLSEKIKSEETGSQQLNANLHILAPHTSGSARAATIFNYLLILTVYSYATLN